MQSRGIPPLLGYLLLAALVLCVGCSSWRTVEWYLEPSDSSARTGAAHAEIDSDDAIRQAIAAYIEDVAPEFYDTTRILGVRETEFEEEGEKRPALEVRVSAETSQAVLSGVLTLDIEEGVVVLDRTGRTPSSWGR